MEKAEVAKQKVVKQTSKTQLIIHKTKTTIYLKFMFCNEIWGILGQLFRKIFGMGLPSAPSLSSILELKI